MKETTALNQISRIVDKLNYKSVYIEIQTKDNRFTLEKDCNKKIGFEGGVGNEKRQTKSVQQCEIYATKNR